MYYIRLTKWRGLYHTEQIPASLERNILVRRRNRIRTKGLGRWGTAASIPISNGRVPSKSFPNPPNDSNIQLVTLFISEIKRSKTPHWISRIEPHHEYHQRLANHYTDHIIIILQPFQSSPAMPSSSSMFNPHAINLTPSYFDSCGDESPDNYYPSSDPDNTPLPSPTSSDGFATPPLAAAFSAKNSDMITGKVVTSTSPSTFTAKPSVVLAWLWYDQSFTVTEDVSKSTYLKVEEENSQTENNSAEPRVLVSQDSPAHLRRLWVAGWSLTALKEIEISRPDNPDATEH